MARVYFAGPDVFRNDWNLYKEYVASLCQSVGLVPVFPDDAPGGSSTSIFQQNLSRIDSCDMVCANLKPFRGCEPDSGTVFEVAYAYAHKKPVLAIVPNETVEERTARLNGPLTYHDENWQIRDSDGIGVEGFGYKLNLMLAKSIHEFTSLEDAISYGAKYER